ncbi:MAG TPA: peptidase [Clostridiales bacterium]|nr:MAG: peptidase [Clostridiales bacterium GWD2_32_19]HCC06604.1 peptidase [Clostridiales bacterium]
MMFGGIFLFVIIVAIASVKIISQSTIGLIERLGKFHKKAETGVNFLIPFLDNMKAVIDLREQVIDFPPQAVITKDNIAMQIDTVIYFKVTDPVNFIYQISNPLNAIENLTATTLRNIIGDLDLDGTLTSRDIVNTKLREILDVATDPWGIKVNRVELKNIMPPRDIQDSMERQMRAERLKREAILTAEGQKLAAITTAEGLKQAAILNAEADKESNIRRSEGEKEAQILRATGEAEAIILVQEATAKGNKVVLDAIKAADPSAAVISIKGIEALEKMAQSNSAKLIIPSEAVSLLGSIAGVKEMLSGKK